MKTFDACIVIPSNRRDYIHQFLVAWQPQFSDHHIIIVEDNATKSFNITDPNVTHIAWNDIDEMFGEDAWIIPRRTDCIRSAGYLLAYRRNVDLIVTLDDDCFPTDSDFLDAHWRRLQAGRVRGWVSTGLGTVPRGVPYFHAERDVQPVLNHGMWLTVPDYDAVTQLSLQRVPGTFEAVTQTIPIGTFFPMCGMNLAWLPIATPAMYFLLMGAEYDYDRFGDIWAGVIFKRIADHLGFAVNSGIPLIDHRRASNVWANLRKEARGLEINEELWKRIAGIVLTKETFAECYLEIAEKLPATSEYESQLKRAMRLWVKHCGLHR